MPEQMHLTAGDVAVRLVLVVLLVLANGFFVAAEFALVGARRTRIETLARTGNRRARLARHAIQHLDHYLSATQLGITLASLGLGWVGETTLAAILIQGFGALPRPWDLIATHAAASVVAFTAITVLHIVLGELAPKSLAILLPEATSLWTAGPLIGFSRLLSPFIYTLNGAANLLLRALGLRAATEMERVHRPEEIELLITQSYEHGLLREEPVEMIRGVFDLSETTAGQVMTPRTDVVALPITATVDEAADLIIASGHSRLPVYEESLDRVLGILLARDVWRAQRLGTTSIRELVRPVPFVPDSKPIEGLLREMQQERVHLAVVVDEFGGTAGIVTIEDVIEEIVGEIGVEYADEEADIEVLPSGEIVLDGALPIADLNERYRLELPDHDYNTVSGYIMGQLGRIPRAGDEVRFPGGRFRVVSMDGRRVDRLALIFEPEPSRAGPPPLP